MLQFIFLFLSEYFFDIGLNINKSIKGMEIYIIYNKFIYRVFLESYIILVIICKIEIKVLKEEGKIINKIKKLVYKQFKIQVFLVRKDNG